MVAETARPGHHDPAVRRDGRDGARMDFVNGFDSIHAESIEHGPSGFATREHQICGVIDDPGGDVGEGVHQAMCVLGGNRPVDGESHCILRYRLGSAPCKKVRRVNSHDSCPGGFELAQLSAGAGIGCSDHDYRT